LGAGPSLANPSRIFYDGAQHHHKKSKVWSNLTFDFKQAFFIWRMPAEVLILQ
jgi:hypothetical protein